MDGVYAEFTARIGLLGGVSWIKLRAHLFCGLARLVNVLKKLEGGFRRKCHCVGDQSVYWEESQSRVAVPPLEKKQDGTGVRG